MQQVLVQNSIHTYEIAPSTRPFLEMAVDQEHAIEKDTFISKRSGGISNLTNMSTRLFLSSFNLFFIPEALRTKSAERTVIVIGRGKSKWSFPVACYLFRTFASVG